MTASIFASLKSGPFDPAGLFTTTPLPLTLLSLDGSGNAVVNRNASDYFMNSPEFTYNPTTIDVSTSSGLTTAVRTSTAGSHVRLTADITIDPALFGLRSTDASQASGNLGKLIDTNGHNLIFRTVGPSLPAQIWVQDVTNTNCWTTTLAVTGSQAISRVLRTDVLDAAGQATPFWKVTTSLADLNAFAGDAFFVSGTSLSVKLSTNGSVEAFKANLKGLYVDTTGNSRILVSGAALGLWNNGGSLWLDGVSLSQIDAASRWPIIVIEGITQTYGYSKGFDPINCGLYLAQDSFIYGNKADGANGFSPSVVKRGLCQEVNSRFIRNGDRRTYPIDDTLQGVSVHGGSDHAAFACDFDLNNGQGVADTCINNSADVTWLVGCEVTGGLSNAANYQFGSAATSASRKVHLDRCTSSAAPAAGDLLISTNATVYTRNTSFTKVTGTPIPY